MTPIEGLLNDTDHRPWILPEGGWRYYQEWNNAIFLHWKLDASELKALVPANIRVDTFEGRAWVSLVAFTMENIRPKYLPALSPVSTFHEINVRTYLTDGEKPGVYFLSIEAEKSVAAATARWLSGLPYRKSTMKRQTNGKQQQYLSTNAGRGFGLDLRFTIGERITPKSELDKWLSERYCLYLDNEAGTHRYEIHHREWDLYKVDMIGIKTSYTLGGIHLDRSPDLVHYSPGVKVVAWKRGVV